MLGQQTQLREPSASASRATTTLHLTLLTSHYLGVVEADEILSACGASGGHKKEAANAKGTVAAPKATCKEKDTYACRTSAEQLDSVARVLRYVLHQRCLSSSSRASFAAPQSADHECDCIALHAHHVQLAKAVRDGALSWAELKSLLGGAKMGIYEVKDTTLSCDGARPKMSTVPVVGEQPGGNAAAASAKPTSRSSSRSRGSRRNSAGGGGGGGGANRRSASLVSSRRDSALTSNQQIMTDEESRCCQAFLISQLPPCEVVAVPAAAVSPEDGQPFPSSSPSSQSHPVFFLYHLVNEEEVVAALAALSGAEADSAAGEVGGPFAERERCRARARQATMLVTNAVWCTLRPALRSYLHSVGATTVPSHLSVVWAMAEPCLLEGLNSYTGKNAGGNTSFLPCSLTMPASRESTADSDDSVDAASVERWVRLVPRSAIYLYDPVMSSGPGSAVVETALAVLQCDGVGGPRGLGGTGPAKGNRRWSNADGGGKSTPSSQRSGQAAGATASAAAHKASRATGGAAATVKGRGGNARGDGASASSAGTAAREFLLNSLTGQMDAIVPLDMDAEPSAFPYCAADPMSLACYMYAGCENVTDGATNTPFTREQRNKAVTSFLSKAVAYQRAVLATISTNTLTSVEAKSSLRVTAEVLKWVQAFFASPTTKDEERDSDAQHNSSSSPKDNSGSLLSPVSAQAGGTAGERTIDFAALLGDLAKTSLMRTGLDSNKWPLPLWTITAVPLAVVPPLPLRSASRGNSTDSGGNTAKDVSLSQLELNALSILSSWVCALKGIESDAGNVRTHQSSGMEVALQQVTRLSRLVGAYAAWTQTNLAPCLVDRSSRLPQSHIEKETRKGGDASGPVQFTHDSYTGGIFTSVNGVLSLMAEPSRYFTRERALLSLTAVCASQEEYEIQSQTSPSSPAQAVARPTSSSLFHRYKKPFQRLAVAHKGGGEAAEAAVVPRETPVDSDGAWAARCSVKGSHRKEGADVVLPPYPQEVVATVRQIVAKNAGHFEVNTTRGTDTISAALLHGGGSCAMSAMVDSTMTGSSFSPTGRQIGTLNTTTQSTGLLLRQQHQQQRRRQREQCGSVVTALRPYLHGVRLVKEVSKAFLGRRPNMEAAVLLQEALEFTLSTPPEWRSVEQGMQCLGGTCGKSEKAYIVKTNALELLQRYLLSSCALSSPNPQAEPSATTAQLLSSYCGLAKKNDDALSAVNAASAAAQSLTPRVYEHYLQQVLLHQLLREVGLEVQATPWPPTPRGNSSERDGRDNGAEDWTVTEQVPVEAIVSTLVDFRERFGAHNVVLKASTLDYQLHSTVPGSALPPSTSLEGKAGTSAPVPNEAAKETDEAHRTSAYAHNALNVHPSRRVTQLWLVGVALPNERAAEGADVAGRHCSKKGKEKSLSSPSLRFRTRKWIDMVPRAGTVTSMEVYAAWCTLLRTDLGKKALYAITAESTPIALEGGKSSPALTADLIYQLIQQYVQRHAEASTACLSSVDTSPHATSEKTTVSAVPMRFSTHETLYPYGDALLEVWFDEAQRTCRYIKASEVTAALHTGARSPTMLSTPLHLSVRWDDGLLFSCGTTGAQQSSFVPQIDVRLTTTNVVLQRCAVESRLQLRRYPNTSSFATAAGIAVGNESNAQPTTGPPQGLLSEVCSSLFEERTTLYCVHDCPPLENLPAPVEGGATVMEATIETSVEEAEVSSEVDERTGVVYRIYPSGTQLLQFPSGAMLTRCPIAAENTAAVMVAAKSGASSPLSSSFSPPAAQMQQWCETLVTCDGRCFVRLVCNPAKFTAPPTSAGTAVKQKYISSANAVANSVFRRVAPRMIKDGLPPAFTHTETTYDAVRHCHVRSRQDGLTVVEYSALLDASVATTPTAVQQKSATVVARVAVFPDGTSITTLAHRGVRRRVLSTRHAAAAVRGGSLPAAVALSSSSLCAMLEEVDVVERGLFGLSTAVEAGEEGAENAAAGIRSSVRWLVEAPTFPRFYLAPAEEECNAAFCVVFGDGTILQRHWLPAATPRLPLEDAARSRSSNTTAAYRGGHPSAEDNDGVADEHSNQDVVLDSLGVTDSTSYNGGTVATVLIRPSTSAVRVLHQHAVATVEPADVLASITRASPAAYAVGLGLPFFDFAYGGGMRLVDAARCVWEIFGLAASSGPKVSSSGSSRTYEELLRELVSANYSPHRLPRAAELAYASEHRRECLAYAQQRSTGWCPPLVRRLRELSEPYIRTAHLLRSDVLAPMEAAAAAVAKNGEITVTGRATPQKSSAQRAVPAATRTIASIRPVCFGQLANGESIRYWCAKDVMRAPSSADAMATSVTAIANEPHVLEHVVPAVSAGGVLRYICNAPSYASAADVMAMLSGGRGDVGCVGSALDQRLAEARRLSLLCVGGLAPTLLPSSTNESTPHFAATYASELPPLAVLISHGCRWLPPSLQPPQQFSSAYSKSVVQAIAAQSDVVWVHDATAPVGALGGATAYTQYMTEHVEPGVPPVMLQAAVARRELRRYEDLAQLSHYHRVLTAQWPMEQPDAAREEQACLEMRYEELRRLRHPKLSEEKPPFSFSFLPKDSSAAENKQQPFSLLPN